jgi:hypothetical protein
MNGEYLVRSDVPGSNSSGSGCRLLPMALNWERAASLTRV